MNITKTTQQAGHNQHNITLYREFNREVYCQNPLHTNPWCDLYQRQSLGGIFTCYKLRPIKPIKVPPQSGYEPQLINKTILLF